MNKYKVIWFDDEHEVLNIIREKAFLNDIELVGYNNAKQGIEELEKNIEHYDAALIDGLFFANAEQLGVPSSDKPLFDVAMVLKNLESIKKLPWFILSGQMSFTKDKNRYADGLKDNQVYDKLNDAHLDNLWNDIKAEANKLPEMQLKHKYNNLFELCENRYLGEKHFDRLFTIIKRIDSNDAESGFEDMLNPLRKLLEAVFTRLGDFEIIPEKIIKNKGWINGCSLFLSNKHSDYRFIEEIIHPLAAENIYRLLNIIQDGSHGEGELKLRVDQYLKSRNNDYLYRSAVYLLLDILIWLKELINQFPNASENKNLWYELKSDLLSGILMKDNMGNYHCGDIIFTYKHINDNSYNEGDEVRFIKVVENTNEKTMKLYSKSVLKSEKIN